MPYSDLRDWLAMVDEAGDLKRVSGADWYLEIGAITQLSQVERARGRALLFDNIPGFPAGYRVATNFFTAADCFARTVNLPTGLPSKKDYLDAWVRKYSNPPRISPTFVAEGPVMENAHYGDDVDLLEFPTPQYYEKDGGRYIGTAGTIITRDPDEGWVNLGTYRVMLLDKNRVICYMSPGRHGRIHRDKWFSQGKPCPIAITVGQDPLLFVLASTEQPYGISEYEIAGGIKGEPIDLIEGPGTGLPIPARAEIVIEGECTPDETATEGPFGEWTGYYGSGARQEPVIRVKAVYHRHDPIMTGSGGARAPYGISFHGQILHAALIKGEMERAGIPGVTGVWCHQEGGDCFLTAVSIKNSYPGHSRQAGLLAASCQAGVYARRYVIVVDDDIDVSNLREVIWAVCSRTDPATSIDILRKTMSTPLDPMITPEDKAKGRYYNSRGIIDACRPYEWRDQFPAVVEMSKELRQQMLEKWREEILG